MVCIFLRSINRGSYSAKCALKAFYDFHVLFFPGRLPSDFDYVKVEDRYHLGHSRTRSCK